jgi:hypothetical protein
MNWIRSFDDVGMADVASVGGKNASLGEMRRALTRLGIRTPDGFATTADAYRAFMRGADLDGVVRNALANIDISDIGALQGAGARVRSAILAARLPPELILRCVHCGWDSSGWTIERPRFSDTENRAAPRDVQRVRWTASSAARCSRPFEASMPVLRSRRRPPVKSSGWPARSVTRPPASSINSDPAA